MSPSENVERTRRAYEAFNSRDWRTFGTFMHPDIEVESRLVAMEGGYRGEEEIICLRSLGTGHGAASETPVHDPFWQVLEWRDGKCVWWRNCSTEAEANEAIAARTAPRR